MLKGALAAMTENPRNVRSQNLMVACPSGVKGVEGASVGEGVKGVVVKNVATNTLKQKCVKNWDEKNERKEKSKEMQTVLKIENCALI